ncbi:MAG: hypothetical protein V7L29_13080 [Nostoc sp.]|uniref:hypothetical protein n=1 Tax=Nostoc sp. TaxID=1180 RepID=UPI002FEF4659
MQQILLALGQALRKSLLIRGILGLMIFLLGLFIFIQPPSYAGQGQNEMVKGSQAKIQQKVDKKAEQVTSGLEEPKKARGADRPLDVQEEQLKKGVVEEAKVIGDLLTGKKPDGTSVFDSDN